MTRYTIFILTVYLTLIACTDRTADKFQTDTNGDESSVYANTTTNKDSVISVDTFSIPTNYFIDIVSIFDSAGFKADTNRIKKVSYYSWIIKTNPVFIVKQIPFYKMDTVTNPIFNFLKQGTYNLHYSQVDTVLRLGQLKKACSKVKTITGFYFTEKLSSSLRTDGFVEEWEFPDSNTAKSAETELINTNGSLSKIYYFIYFNSYAQVFRRDNYLYTFYSRACWDAKLLDKIYGQIIKNIDADSWTTTSGQTKIKNDA